MNTGRDLRVDFFRGLALIFIFWDHVPGNPLANLTVRNIGFSDAAEIFVFLAGFAAATAYGKIAVRSGWLVACVRMLRRAWVLYVAHIFLLVVLMGMVFVANTHVQTRDMVDEMGLRYFLDNPQKALIDELLLRFKPNLMDPLPLYILLLAALPAVLPLLMRYTTLTLGLSLTLYALVQVFKWNLPAQEGSVWFFNPLAWQLLFVLGGMTALYRQRAGRVEANARWRKPVLLISVAIVLACALITLLWRWPSVHDAVLPAEFRAWLYPIDKTNLAPARLLQFLALAYCTAYLVSSGSWLQHWSARQCCRMGRYSLEVFCLGVLLAPLADMLNALGDDCWWIQVGTALTGVAIMVLLAQWLDWTHQLERTRSAEPIPA